MVSVEVSGYIEPCNSLFNFILCFVLLLVGWAIVW